jgi:hypothetical protein
MISSVRSRTSKSLAFVLDTSEVRSSDDNALKTPVYLNRTFSIAELAALFGVAAFFRVSAVFSGVVAVLFSVVRLMASGAPLA